MVDNHKTDLPIKKGLSSSAAICVLVARAFNRVYDLKLTTRGEMELAYQGEITTPSRCGRMDQGCAYGNRPLLMTFDGDRLDVKEPQISGDLHFVIVDLNAQKDTTEILTRLNRCFPYAETRVEKGVPHIWGGKGVGSQGDGTAQVIARSETDQKAVIEILERDFGMPCLTLSLQTTPKVRKALIPAAGFGTRLFPATKAAKKELFPIVDRDGIAKPAILLIVEEALRAGVEQVIIVVQAHDLDAFEGKIAKVTLSEARGLSYADGDSSLRSE